MRDRRQFIATLVLLSTFLSAASSLGQDRRGAKLSFLIVGSREDVGHRFGADLYQTLERERNNIEPVLLAIAEQPLLSSQIVATTQLSRTQVLDLIARLEAVHVVKQDSKKRWATTLPVITDDQMKRMRESLIPMAREVARKVADGKPQLEALYQSVRSTTDPAWDDVAHLMIDKYIVDGSFHAAIGTLERERGIDQRDYSRDQQIIPAFFLERGEHFCNFGANWYVFHEGEAQREVYVLHGSVFRRYDIRMSVHSNDAVLSAALFGLTPAGGIESLAANERETLRGLGWIENDRLLVPVVQAKTITALMPVVEKIGAAAAPVVLNNHAVILKAFDRSPYSWFLRGRGDYVQACYHVLFSLVVEQLAETGVLPAIPDRVPENFGVYIIIVSADSARHGAVPARRGKSTRFPCAGWPFDKSEGVVNGTPIPGGARGALCAREG